MAYQLELLREAKNQIIEGYYWYAKEGEQLANRFVEEVERRLDYITRYPFHYQIRKDTFREAVLSTFPYVIIYEVVDTQVVVYSIFPTRRNEADKP